MPVMPIIARRPLRICERAEGAGEWQAARKRCEGKVAKKGLRVGPLPHKPLHLGELLGGAAELGQEANRVESVVACAEGGGICLWVCARTRVLVAVDLAGTQALGDRDRQEELRGDLWRKGWGR
eukprot:gene7933-biopygen10985